MPNEDLIEHVTSGILTDGAAVEDSLGHDVPSKPGGDTGGPSEHALDRHRLQQQIALSEFGLHTLQTSDLDDLLQQATEMCAKGMSVRLCKALRHDRKEHMLSLCAGVGWRDGAVGQATVGADLASSAGYALPTGKPVISNYLENEEMFCTPQLMVDHGVRRAINVLITAHRQPWGVLEVDSPDEGQFEIEDIAFMQGFANLLGVAIERHDAEKKLQEAVELQRLLVLETSHRVKNSLAMVSSLLHLQSRSGVSQEKASALGEAEARIATIAEAHDQLWRSAVAGEIEIREFLTDLRSRLGRQSAGVRAACDVDRLVLGAERAIAVGLLVTELVTNAMKYAYPDGEGVVDVAVKANGAEFTLTVSDQGRGLPTDFNLSKASRDSLGMRMIESLARELGSKVTIAGVRGTTFKITAALQ